MKFILAFLISIPTIYGMPWMPQTPAAAVQLGLVEAGPPVTPACSTVHLQACQYNFNTILGIPGNLDWTTPIDFTIALQNIYYQQGTKGIMRVCAAYTNFTQCLGATYPSCINPLFFIQNGYNLVAALTYPGLLAQLHFQCGGGMETILANWNSCIGPGQVSYNATIQNCLIQYAANSFRDPFQSCFFANELLNCVRTPFQMACPQPFNMPSMWFICEYFRVAVQTHLPYCQMRCLVGQFSEQNDINLLLKDKSLDYVWSQIGKGPKKNMYHNIAKHAKNHDKSVKL